MPCENCDEKLDSPQKWIFVVSHPDGWECAICGDFLSHRRTFFAQEVKKKSKPASIFDIAFAKMDKEITTAWNNFLAELSPEQRVLIGDSKAFLNQNLMEAAEQWAEEELKRQIKGTSHLIPAGLLNANTKES